MWRLDKHLFSLKRKEQIETAEKVWGIDDYAKQYKTISFVLETIFPVSVPVCVDTLVYTKQIAIGALIMWLCYLVITAIVCWHSFDRY